MSETMTGGCQCGRIRYAVRVEDQDALLCHCRMCQRATGGVAAALKQVPRAALTWEREPDRYRSSLIAQRGFCRACGTPLTWEGDGDDSVDLTVGSFDDPSRLVPAIQTGVESRHDAWSDTRGLRALRTDEIPGVVAKWKAAGADVPA